MRAIYRHRNFSNAGYKWNNLMLESENTEQFEADSRAPSGGTFYTTRYTNPVITGTRYSAPTTTTRTGYTQTGSSPSGDELAAMSAAAEQAAADKRTAARAAAAAAAAAAEAERQAAAAEQAAAAQLAATAASAATAGYITSFSDKTTENGALVSDKNQIFIAGGVAIIGIMALLFK